MTIPFGSWVWEWAKSQDETILKALQDEIVGDGWLFRQPAQEQTVILDGAPIEFIQSIARHLKPEAAVDLGCNPFIKTENT